MRIVFISREHPLGEDVGGIATYTQTVTRALARRGHEVRVVTRGAPAVLIDDGVSVVRLKHQWVPVALAERLLAAQRAATAAMSFRPDIVQAAEWEAEAWWLARRDRVPVVTRLATPTYLVEYLNLGHVNAGSGLVRRLERDQAHRSAALLAPSRALADRVGRAWRIPEDRIEVIPNPLDGDAVRQLAAAEPLSSLPSRFLAFLGRLERRDFGAALTVHFAGRLDQIHFKLYALVDQGLGRHESDLRALAPTREELLVAASWTRTHDPSEGFREQLEGALRYLGVEDVDLGA